MAEITLYKGDCLIEMNKINDKSVDMILCDLPYQVTQNSWDIIIPFDEMWKQVNRVIKDNACICFFCDGMFQAKLMLSNEKMWRYNLVWNKVLCSGFLNANKMPLRTHEEISVFYKSLPTYNPQKTRGKPLHGMGQKFKTTVRKNNNYGKIDTCKNPSIDREGDTDKFPISILTFPRKASCNMIHPTEKSVELLQYLIKTYTNENETVLDFTMGSGSTGVACKFTNRNFIGIEKDDIYFEIAKQRIENPETFSKPKEDKVSKYDLF